MAAPETLDALGLKCPLPVLRARKRLLAMPPGAVLRVRADDPVAVIDLPNFCREAGHELLEITPAPKGAHDFLIRRACATGAP